MSEANERMVNPYQVVIDRFKGLDNDPEVRAMLNNMRARGEVLIAEAIDPEFGKVFIPGDDHSEFLDPAN